MVSALNIGRAKTFALCYTQYLFAHSCRQCWNVVSGQIQQNGLVEGFTAPFLGWINFSFLLSYGIAVLLFGKLGDAINTKTFLLTGQFLTGIIFGLIGLLHHYELSHKNLILFLMILNGIAQSTAWPGVVTIIDNWFPKYRKLILMGKEVIYNQVILQLVQTQEILLVILSAFFLLLISLINLIFLKSKPDHDQDLIHNPEICEKIKQETNMESQSLTFITVWLVPGVALYAIAFGFVKAVFFVLGFWLPSYLKQNNVTHTTFIASMLDFGTMAGGISICYLGFYTNKRASIIIPTLLLGTFIMVMTSYLKVLGDPYLLYIILVFLMGLTIGGVYNNIAGGIAVELGGQFQSTLYTNSIQDNKKSVCTIVSVIEGYGSVFAAINQIIVSHIENFLFIYCGLLCFFTSITLLPFLKTELSRKTPGQIKYNESTSQEEQDVNMK